MSDQIAVRQSQVDKLYAGLQDLGRERRRRLDETLQLYGLHREIDDLLQWIADKEIVAGSQELGQDLEHVQMLQERFHQFARDVESIGSERVGRANEASDALMASGHSDAPTIALWKDSLNEAWENLLELMDTRTQMLDASRLLHKFFHDCRDCLSRILEKTHAVPEELGRDSSSVGALQRKHAAFLKDLEALEGQVRAIQTEAADLSAAYAGDKAVEIAAREREVVDAWRQLAAMTDGRRAKLADTADLFRFMQMVRDLLVWMDGVRREMNTQERPRDVSGVELLMNNHQSLKAEIDARQENFGACIALGKALLDRQHYASSEIEKKLIKLTQERAEMMRRWEDRWEYLQLILEVYQFARDAAVADAWLSAQEPYLLSKEYGRTLEEVIKLIKKHEAFEKSASAQEERFQALEKLTTYELKEIQRRQEEEDKKRRGKVGSPGKHETTFPAEHGAEGESRVLKQLQQSQQQYDQPSSWRMSLSRMPKFEHHDPPGMVSPEGGFEGVLIRKHTQEDADHKASNRSWEKRYCALRGSQLFFYKDQRHKEEQHAMSGEGAGLELRGGVAEVADSYTKKRHVLELRLPSGGQYLFQARDEEDMQRWLQYLEAATGQAQRGEEGRRSSKKAGGGGGGGGGGGFFSRKK